MVTLTNVRQIFTFQAPSPAQQASYLELRDLGHELARGILLNCPEGSDRELAIHHVRAAVMWANAAIATSHVRPT